MGEAKCYGSLKLKTSLKIWQFPLRKQKIAPKIFFGVSHSRVNVKQCHSVILMQKMVMKPSPQNKKDFVFLVMFSLDVSSSEPKPIYSTWFACEISLTASGTVEFKYTSAQCDFTEAKETHLRQFLTEQSIMFHPGNRLRYRMSDCLPS